MSEQAGPQAEVHRRAHPRLRLGIAAALETLDGNQGVRLIDVSQSGAHVLLSHPKDIRRAVLCWLEFEAFGSVVWRDGDHAGLEFEDLVPMEQLVETRQRAPSVVRDEALGGRIAARDFVAGNLAVGSER